VDNTDQCQWITLTSASG